MSNKMKTFSMKDIHSGYVVKFRNGKYALCMRVGRNFTKIFACVDTPPTLEPVEEHSFVYASNYRESNQYFSWHRVTNRPVPKHDFDIIAVYGLLEGTTHYLLVGSTNDMSISSRPLLWEEEVKEMTLDEIEMKLGHRVKIVNNEKSCNAPIKTTDLCKACKYGIIDYRCRCGTPCDKCAMADMKTGACKCLLAAVGQPCPYFKEVTNND